MSHNEHRHRKYENKAYKCSKASKKVHSHSKKYENKLNKMCFSHLKRAHDIDSEYLGSKRLTNRIGIFDKVKISDSISRMEKKVPKRVKARVSQDLKEILKVTKNDRHVHHSKHKKKSREISDTRPKIGAQSCNLSVFFNQNSGFASPAWEDKLQKSVKMNSVLASVCNEPLGKSPVFEEIHIAKRTLETFIFPTVQKANCTIFPNVSNKAKIKHKLLEIKSLFDQAGNSDHPSGSKLASNSTSVSDESTVKSSSQQDDFNLNPILTDETVNYDLADIFPPVDDFVDSDGSGSNDADSVFLPDSWHDSEAQSGQGTSFSSKNTYSSYAFVPSSPTSSDNSPALKLKFSFDDFKPAPIPSPTIYFRRKMF